MRESYLDKLRGFIITFPRWDDYGIHPPNDKFVLKSQIAVEDFSSSNDISQLALRLDGSRIVSKKRDVRGAVFIQRRNSHTLFLLKRSDLSSERADTSAFLEDFIEWMDEADAYDMIPRFGDDPLAQTVDINDGAPLAPWDKGQATVYAVRIHINYTKIYQQKNTWK